MENKKPIPELKVGDLVDMKKDHPCGGNRWEILRVGADIRIKCLKCSRVVLIPRVKFVKEIKSIASGTATY